MVRSGTGVEMKGAVVNGRIAQEEEAASLDQAFEYFDSHTDVPLFAIR